MKKQASEHLPGAKAALAAAVAASALAASAVSTPAGFTDDLAAARRNAAGNGRAIVAVFSGSDWCGWCRKLDAEILSTDAFRQTATNAYELVYIDNPRDRSLLSPTGRANNRRLTEQYGIEGFPTVLVLDADGNVLAKLGYQPGGPEPYLARLRQAIEAARARATPPAPPAKAPAE